MRSVKLAASASLRIGDLRSSCRYLNDEFSLCTTRGRVLQSFDGLIEWIDSIDHDLYLSRIDYSTNVFQLFPVGLCEQAEVVIHQVDGRAVASEDQCTT
jgi:hypothetical protein